MERTRGVCPLPSPSITPGLKNLRDRRAAHAIVQQDQRVCSSGQAARDGTIASQLDQVTAGFGVEEARADHAGSRIALRPVGKRRMRILNESRYSANILFSSATSIVNLSGSVPR